MPAPSPAVGLALAGEGRAATSMPPAINSCFLPLLAAFAAGRLSAACDRVGGLGISD